jgi:hypothetical protein
MHGTIPDTSQLKLHCDAALNALRDAGLPLRDIDGVAVSPPLARIKRYGPYGPGGGTARTPGGGSNWCTHCSADSSEFRTRRRAALSEHTLRTKLLYFAPSSRLTPSISGCHPNTSETMRALM